MRSTIRTLAVLTLTSATAAFAQGPLPPAAAGRAGPAAEMLLARTGELGLSDQQVVRLAAIARRSATRRASLRASMDSARQRFAPDQPLDTAARRQFRQRMQADMQRAQEASRADLRDAIAVLTPDQQAKAWEMATDRGRIARGRGMRHGGMHLGPRRQPGMREFRDFRERRDPAREPRPRRTPAEFESQ